MVASLADMASIALSVPTAIPPRGILQLIAHKVSLAIVRWKQKIFPEMFRPALGSCPSPPVRIPRPTVNEQGRHDPF